MNYRLIRPIFVVYLRHGWERILIVHLLLQMDMLRNDWVNKRGGGVAILCRNDWKIKERDVSGNEYECLWAKVSMINQDYFVASVYHPPTIDYCETTFIEFLVNSCENFLAASLNTRLIIAGDGNELDFGITCNTSKISLLQLVKTSTTNDRILEVFLTNTSNIFGKVCTSKGMIKSDHSSVFIFPMLMTIIRA